MVVSIESRRKSIAVAQEGRSTLPKRKRAYSLGPSKLSPLSRSRLSIGNVKGILKSRPSSASSSQGTNSPSSQQSRPQSQSFADENNATISMDITQDYQAPINDNFSRKSMGRRVSFRDSVHVRFFNKDKGNDTGTSASSQESPGGSSSGAPSSDDDPIPAIPHVFNDENAYPGANPRRLSTRKSIAASEDMDMTSTGLGAFINGGDNASALLDEDMGLDDENSDMDITQSFTNEFRRRSSVGVSRVPLSQISSNPPQDQETSFTSEHSYTSEGDNSEAMEITAPLGKSLRPAHQDEAWLALVKATHSGDASMATSDDTEGDGMDDEDVEAMIARDAERRYTVNFNDVSDESMSEASFDDAGNQTLNLSKVMGRPSYGMNMGRPSVASSMDESEIYGEIVGGSASTPPPNPAQPQPNPVEATQEQPRSVSPTRPSSRVFSAPTSNPPAPTPLVFKPPPVTSPKRTTTSTPRSPTKSPAKPLLKSFSAAFAPPVARPTPKRSAETTDEALPSATKKRERAISAPSPAGIEVPDQPSPAKRQALEAKWSNKVAPSATSQPVSASMAAEKNRPLSPSKRIPFESATLERPTNIRRPSGYYARRKSLGAGLASSSSVSQEQGDASSVAVQSSPKKTATLGSRRASVSSGSSKAWARFDRTTVLPTGYSNGEGKTASIAEREEELGNTGNSVVVSPSPEIIAPRSIPASAPPLESMEIEAGPSVSKTPVVDLSAILETSGFGDEEEEREEEEEIKSGPTGMNMAATEQWRDTIPEDGYAVDEGPPISIEQFFELTGIKFMDLTAPRRRSTHASQIPPSEARDPTKIPLAEYAVAMAIDVPQLDHYSRVSRDLEGWMEQSKVEFEQMEEEAAKMTPELFAEYSQANPDEQADMLHQLRLIRTNTRQQAKSDWYKWKLQWIDGLKYTAQRAFTSLQNDAKALEKLRAETDEIVPRLQREYDEVLRELEVEQQEVEEIEQCDQEYLNELKSSIAEQNVEVESLKAEVKEANDQLHWLQDRLEGVSLQKQETAGAIAEATRLLHIQTHSTQAEVWRLNNELEALEDIHMFHVIKARSNVFEYVYASEYHVVIPCRNYSPLTSQIDIVSLPEMRARFKDDLPSLSSFLLNAAKEYIRGSELSTVRQIIQRLADFWSSTTQVRTQLRQLSIKYPVEIDSRHTPDKPFTEFAVRTMVLFPAKKAKAYISFVFDLDTFSQWPVSVGSLRWEVRIGYGPIDEQAILKAVQERMKEVTPSENYACLIDACIDAQEACG
ncbi:hypothetical protein GYMLUDRAFT_65648 [Collybiopsis luxurians FD-317 M1]|nr:hypothetical protein GYMLUDRAFT_65648 [Collybiopsis luxurians FD-317 M1]